MFIVCISLQIVASFTTAKRNSNFVDCTISKRGEWIYGVTDEHILYCFRMENKKYYTLSVCFLILRLISI